MPTEELFGAYHFHSADSEKKPADSFDFKAPDDGETQIALLLPAVQKVETAPEPVDDFAAGAQDDGTVGYTLVELLEIRGRSRIDDGGEWIDILSVSQGVNRSDGGDDFMF